MPASRSNTKEEQLRLSFLSYEDDPALRSFLHVSKDSQTRARRQRALMSGGAAGRGLLGIRDQIDRGVSAVEALASRYKVAPWVIRALATMPQFNHPEIGVPIDTVTRWLSWITPERAPRGEEVWDFIPVMEEIEEIAALIGVDPCDLVGRTQGSWEDLYSKTFGAGASETIHSILSQCARDVFLPEVFLALDRAGLRPSQELLDLCSREWSPTDLAPIGRAMFANKSITGIIDLIERDAYGRGHPLSLPGGEDLRNLLRLLPAWPAPATPAQIDDHHVAVPLTTADAMIDEGLALGHCLGRYALKCAFGPYLAISIRTGGGYRLSSALLRLSPSDQVEIYEHRGGRNSTPDHRSQAALKQFLTELQGNKQAIADWKADRSSRSKAYGKDTPETAALYQFHFAPAREWVFEAYYAPLLPKSDGEMSRDEWLTAKSLKDLAEHFGKNAQNQILQAA